MHRHSTARHAGTTLDLTCRHDEQLAVERVRRGDALALELIFLAYRGELLVLAEHVTGSRAIGEEVLQDVFLAIWRGRDGWHVATSLRVYLRRAVARTGSRARSSRTRGLRAGESIDAPDSSNENREVVDHSPSPLEMAVYADLRTAFETAASELSPRARDVFTLRRERGLSNHEIARRLGLSVKTVETHMGRALRFLRHRLKGWREPGNAGRP